MTYHPPCTVTPEMLSQVAMIAERIGRLQAQPEKLLRLRKVNRVRTIRGSLAIEGNTLTESQITAILQGKRVIAPPKEIQEVRNAARVYENLTRWNPHSERDLCAAHAMLMTDLLDSAGRYRDCNVGVMGQEAVVHMAPPASRVRVLMNDLFAWLNNSTLHPLVTSSIFHYEFEFIHPFEDGNGRMGRFWQTLLLSRWHGPFADLPIESMIYAYQSEYYQALNESTAASDAAPFVSFMLGIILETLVSTEFVEVTPEVTPEVMRLLKVMTVAMPRTELMSKLGLKDEKHFRQQYLQVAVSRGVIEMIIPDKPTSRLQKYRRTPLGEVLLNMERNL